MPPPNPPHWQDLTPHDLLPHLLLHLSIIATTARQLLDNITQAGSAQPHTKQQLLLFAESAIKTTRSIHRILTTWHNRDIFYRADIALAIDNTPVFLALYEQLLIAVALADAQPFCLTISHQDHIANLPNVADHANLLTQQTSNLLNRLRAGLTARIPPISTSLFIQMDAARTETEVALTSYRALLHHWKTTANPTPAQYASIRNVEANLSLLKTATLQIHDILQSLRKHPLDDLLQHIENTQKIHTH